MDKTQAESRAGSNISPAAHDRCSDDEGSESGDLSGTSSEKQRPLDTRAELREATQEEASKALHDFSWIDLTEPDPKYNGAAMRNERLAPIWKEEQDNEMTGLFGRGCLKKIKRSELPMGTRVISSRFHYKIKRHSAGEHKLRVKRLKVRLVVQGQHMSEVRCCMSMATAIYISPPPGHVEEPDVVYQVLKPLYAAQ